jgi:alkylhydroperoxidase family enzyme
MMAFSLPDRILAPQGALSKGEHMARISYIEKAQAPPEVQALYERFERALGRVPNIFKAMAHAPEFLQKLLEFDGAVRAAKLDGKLRELAYLKASQVNGCEY